MQVFKEISTLLLEQKPFVCYVKPNESVWNLLLQQNEEWVEFTHQDGFVFIPFQEGKQVVIPFEGNLFLQGNFENQIKKTPESFTAESNQKQSFENIIENKKYSHTIKINNENYFLFTKKMEKTSWYIISLIKEENVLKDIKNLEDYYTNLGYVIILIIFFFYAIFFFFLHYKAKFFVSQINNPLVEIIKLTKNIGKTKEIKVLESCGIIEIDKLSNNFNNLILELDKRTNNLIIEETKRIYQEKLANTDPLTGAYNRRYLNEFANDYLKIVKREKIDFSLLIVDLDDFKNINDTYGHEIGDLVLIQFVKIARETIRENDLIIRFGGDEFILLLPNTNIKNAKIIATKIINRVSEYNMSTDVNFLISIGIADYQEKDLIIDDIISRADKSLYEAKRAGKNRAV